MDTDIREAMSELPERATIRWRGYDYASVGAYFLTICTRDRLHLFGRIVDGVMHPSPIGEWAQRCWDAIPEHMPHVDVGEFVVMPNHVHGIVIIRERAGDVRRVGARHDAPGMGAVGVPGNVDGAFDPMTDDPGTGMPGGDHDTTDTPGPHTRARHDAANAPPHDPRARHDAPGVGAVGVPGNVDGAFDPLTDDPGTGMPGGDPDTADAQSHHTRARHDAPQRDRARPPGIPRGALGQIVASYKSAVTRMAYRDGLVPRGTPVWQRNYWDRVIRDDGEHERIAKYIRDNPMNWKGDRFNR